MNACEDRSAGFFLDFDPTIPGQLHEVLNALEIAGQTITRVIVLQCF